MCFGRRLSTAAISGMTSARIFEWKVSYCSCTLSARWLRTCEHRSKLQAHPFVDLVQLCGISQKVKILRDSVFQDYLNDFSWTIEILLTVKSFNMVTFRHAAHLRSHFISLHQSNTQTTSVTYITIKNLNASLSFQCQKTLKIKNNSKV